jgi:isocitrate dehydrogenase kinase/phosphatase
MPKPVVWLLVLAVGAAAYVVGAKAGRARYREISAGAKQLWDDPTVKKVRQRSRKAIEKAAKKASKKLGG